MTSSWKDLPIDHILDQAPGSAEQGARLDRIMQHYTTLAYDRLTEATKEAAERQAIASNNQATAISNQGIVMSAATKAQTKQQKRLFWLTVVIALATIAYTASTVYAAAGTWAGVKQETGRYAVQATTNAQMFYRLDTTTGEVCVYLTLLNTEPPVKDIQKVICSTED